MVEKKLYLHAGCKIDATPRKVRTESFVLIAISVWQILTRSVSAVAREQGGGLAGAEPLQLFGWGARNVFDPPPNSRNRFLLRSENC